MNQVIVYKDKFLLDWDGVLPPQTPSNAVHEPEDVPYMWRYLRGFARYSKRSGKYVLNLSTQNLHRLMLQFRGNLDFRNAEGDPAYRRMLQEAEKIKKYQDIAYKCKNAPFEKLPQYDYKIPPLGEWQHREVVYLVNMPVAPLFADCGCLSGETIIRVNRRGKSFKTRLDALYKSFHRKNRKSEIKVRSLCDEIIQLNEVVDVKQSGVKLVYKLSLKDGKSVKVTGDHLIMTDDGWVQARHLHVGSRVMVDNLSRHQKSKTKKKKKRTSDKRVAVGKYHPFARKQLSHKGRSHSFLIEIHRAVYEAHINGMALEEFIDATHSKDSRSLNFIDPKRYAIHHIDGDHFNNDPINLVHMDHREHFSHHTNGYRNFGHGKPEFSEVVCILSLGKEMTYDICCKPPHHNFVANGMVVHNSGKTFAVLTSTEQQIKKGVLKRGKTLVAAKLATLETGWLEDAEKFTDLKVQILWEASSYKKKEKICSKMQEPADIYVINHDGLRVYEEQLTAMNFEKVVVDESTILKGFRGMDPRTKGGAFGKALHRVSHNAKYRVIMSGTPSPNGPVDLWGQFAFLDPTGILLEPNFRDFETEYYEAIDLRPSHMRYQTNPDGSVRLDVNGKKISKPMGPKTPRKMVPKKGAPEAINQLIHPISYRVKLRDHVEDFPELTIMKRFIQMSPAQKKHYKDMKEKLKVEINDERITVPIALAKLMKLRQITGGFIIDNEEKAHEIETAPKLLELQSLVQEEIAPDEKIVVYAQYRWEIEEITKRYKDRGCVSVYGGNNSRKNLDNIKAFREDPEVRMIVLHPKSAAHGITFTMARYMIFYSISHSAEDNYQCIKRIERAGQKNAMFVYYLLCKQSIDDEIYLILNMKDRMQERVIDGQNDIDKQLLDQWRSG
jgi:hypothetical protein